MALASHTGSAHRIGAETLRCRGGNMAFNFSTHAESLKMKEISIGSSSLSCSSRNIMHGLHIDSARTASRRGDRVIVAASPPTEDATVATEPLTKEDLVAYLASGCKPKEKWRIGTEHEKFGFNIETLRPMTYEQIAGLLNGIAERFDWEKIMEGDNIIGLQQGKQSISLEPGGQFELSGAPLETLHQTCAEVNSHLYQVKAVAEEMGIGFLGIGFQPKWSREDIPIMPKVGLLYDEVSLQNVLDITADWTQGERQMLRNKVPVSGLNTPFRDGLVKHVAQDIVKLAKDGLERRGFKESGFLNEVTEVARTGVTPAEKLLELYNGKWGRNVDPVFEELLY